MLSDALSIAIDRDWERRIRDAARNRDDLTRRISEDEESGGSESNLAFRLLPDSSLTFSVTERSQ